MPAGGAHADSIQGKPLSRDSKNLQQQRRHWSRGEIVYRRARRQLESLVPVAIATLQRMLSSEDERIALMAAQDLLNRAGLNAPREQKVSVDLKATADEHVKALIALARAAKPQPLIEQPMIEVVEVVSETTNDGDQE